MHLLQDPQLKKQKAIQSARLAVRRMLRMRTGRSPEEQAAIFAQVCMELKPWLEAGPKKHSQDAYLVMLAKQQQQSYFHLLELLSACGGDWIVKE